MSEWLKEHAWKTIPASSIEQRRNTSSRNQFNDFPPQNAVRCEPVNVGICRRFRGDLTQFLHSSERHLPAYTVVLLGTLRVAFVNVRCPPWLGLFKLRPLVIKGQRRREVPVRASICVLRSAIFCSAVAIASAPAMKRRGDGCWSAIVMSARESRWVAGLPPVL
jgi:hypothetical protein